jgi:hypothetical protein
VFLDHDTAALLREHRQAQRKAAGRAARLHGPTTTSCSASLTAGHGTPTT